eukprot:scaffold21218_cov34-Phaeocystis_antarctica.AAC.1
MELDVQKNRASTGASFWCAPSFCDRLHPQVQVQVKPSSRCRMVPTDGPACHRHAYRASLTFGRFQPFLQPYVVAGLMRTPVFGA